MKTVHAGFEVFEQFSIAIFEHLTLYLKVYENNRFVRSQKEFILLRYCYVCAQVASREMNADGNVITTVTIEDSLIAAGRKYLRILVNSDRFAPTKSWNLAIRVNK